MSSSRFKVILGLLFFLLFFIAKISVYASCRNDELGDIQLQEQDDGFLISGNSSMVCSDLEILLYCIKEVNKMQGFRVQPISGSWEQFVSFDIMRNIDCCGSKRKTIEISVSCYNGETFKCSEILNEQIKCEPSDECPNINLQANTPQCSDRNQDGKWPVQFDINSQPGHFTGSFNIFFGDGETITLLPSETSCTHLYNCPYSEPPYTVSVVANGCITDPLHTASDIISLDFPSCECPVIEDISHEIQGCTVTLSTNLSFCSESVIQYVWDLGDGTVETTDSSTSPEHIYASNGRYIVTVTLAGTGDNCTSTSTVLITECEKKPECGNGIVERPSETCDGNCPTVCDDNNPCTADTLFAADECNVSCIFTRITDCISGDGCCPANCSSQNDSDCRNGTNGNDDDSSICGIFDWCCWLLALFMGLYIAFWIMWNYNLLPAAWYVGVATLIAFLFWIIVCKPTYCGVLTVLFAAGIVALAIMGVIALIPGSPGPPVVIPSIRSSYPAALLTVLTLIIIPLLFLSGSCVSNCNDFRSCLDVLWERATAGR